MSFRASLILLNIAALAVLAGVIVWRVFSLRRNPERSPANLTPFLGDNELEGRRLERVLGWALLFTLVLAIAVPVYFIYEPTREVQATQGFDERSVARGATLFANKQMKAYEPTLSLLCADCHGTDAKGGSASFVLQPESDDCLEKGNQNNANVPQCLSKQVQWQAPDLTLASLRYSRDQLFQIITYGRPGTPMPAWGVASGKGAKDTQSIDDLVNYLESVKVTPERAKADAAKAVTQYRKDAAALVATKQKALSDAQATLAKAQANPKTSAVTLETDQAAIGIAQAQVAAAIAWNQEAQSLSDGAILFRLNCARCHTKGWSFHITDPARTDQPPLAPQGSGAYGPNLTNGDELLQFPGVAGEQMQFNWVAIGVPANQGYGVRGISSGRMPHFGQVLTKTEIDEIIAYERSL